MIPRPTCPIPWRWCGQAVDAGAEFVLTPECTNALSSNRDRQRALFRQEQDDLTLAALRAEAARGKIWLLIGSLGLLTQDADGRFANRSFLIGPDGGIVARYDKIHMFDVNVSATEVYRESAGYRPGTRAVLADTPLGRIGMTVCYDLRFPHLYRRLAKAGAQILTVPAAFNHLTGAAHWEVLLRARAIETGCWVLAPAQCGFHPETAGGGPPNAWPQPCRRALGRGCGRWRHRTRRDPGRDRPCAGRGRAPPRARPDP
jgi:deaminated glutathione amidase